MSDNNLMPLSDELESAGTYWQTFDIGQGERRLDLLLGDETMLPPDDTSPSNIIEILVANHQAKHTHANKSALDGITSENVEKWNNMGNHTHNEYAAVDHVHEGYASKSDLDLLEDVVNTKAESTHSHSGYASVNHLHENYVTQISLDTLREDVNGKADANHVHNDYAEVLHSHTEYAMSSHAHDNYAEISHLHNDYATVDSLNEVSAVASGKANISHSHNDLYYTETEIDSKLASKADASHNHNGVYDASGSAANALTSAKAYTDSKIDALVGEGASATLDTIGEISIAIEGNQDAIDLLNSAIGNKANSNDLSSHVGDTVKHVTSTERTNWNAAKSHADAAHAPSNAEKNQNAFSNVIVGSTTIAADTVTDTLTLVAGSNITLTPDATNDKITIAAKDTTYTLGSFGITATATELNCVDGVTSNIQTQLNGKASSSHNHNGVYATVSHTHTASNIGAIPSADIATVSEVKTYLSI